MTDYFTGAGVTSYPRTPDNGAMRLPDELVDHMGYEVIRELRVAGLIEAAAVEAAEQCVAAAIRRNFAAEQVIEVEAKKLLDANRALLNSTGGDYFIALQKIKQQLAKQKKFQL